MPDHLVIDTQHHWFGPRYRAVLAAEAARNPGFGRFSRPMGDDHPGAHLHLDELDEAGVDVAVLSIPPLQDDSPARAAAAISEANDELAEACAQAPDRLLMLASLPLPHLDASLEELERVGSHPAVRGVCLGVKGLGYRPDSADLERLLDRIAAKRLLLVVHPGGHEPGPNETFEGYRLSAAFEPLVWTSVVGLRFALSGTLDRFPSLDVVIPHLGGVIPYLAQRLVDQTVGEAEHDVDYYLTNRFYYDNCSFHAPALRCAVETVGAARIVLGSDMPFRGPLRRCVDDVRNADFLTDAQKREMLGGTAARWFTP